MLTRLFSLTCRVVGVLVLAGFMIATFTGAPNALARRVVVAADVGRADAIVVLGGAIDSDGTLQDSSLRRAVAAIGLYHRGLAPRLVMLGMYGEGRVRARLATELGVPREAVIVEGEEPTTRHEAWRVAQILKPAGARTVLLVTDSLHMRRARRLFEDAGISVRPAPTNTGLVVSRTPESRLRLTRALLQEITALAYHRLFGYL